MPIEFATIPLDQLCGEHVLDAVDTCIEKVSRYGSEFEDANAIRFRLDGAVYTAIEDPDDGYRSRMDRLFVTLDVKLANTFPPVKVLIRKKPDSPHGQSNDTLEFLDLITGKTILEVGTDNTDDYYPYFVCTFNPENMPVNAVTT